MCETLCCWQDFILWWGMQASFLLCFFYTFLGSFHEEHSIPWKDNVFRDKLREKEHSVSRELDLKNCNLWNFIYGFGTSQVDCVCWKRLGHPFKWVHFFKEEDCTSFQGATFFRMNSVRRILQIPKPQRRMLQEIVLAMNIALALQEYWFFGQIALHLLNKSNF